MTAGNRVFIDTNVLIYANVAESPLHDVALARLNALHDSETECWLSRQVLREFLATLSRPQAFQKPKPVSTIVKRVRYLEQHFHIAEEDSRVTKRLLELASSIPIGGKQIHDANIVATMLANDIFSLLTHNTTDFQRFAGYIKILPLQDTSGVTE